MGLLAVTLAGCGGGGTGSSDTLAQEQALETPAGTTTTTAPTLAQRQAAAQKVASSDAACTRLTPFYWEIGDQGGKRGGGTGGKAAGSVPSAGTVMPVASASKWVYAATVIESQGGTLSSGDIQALTQRSGYTNFDACSAGGTVSSCLAETGRTGGRNGDLRSTTVDRFFYGGGHQQVLAQRKGWGSYTAAQLGTAVRAVAGMPSGFSYVNPQVAGGLSSSATQYALFLRHLLDGTFVKTASRLGQNAVCTHANGSDCSTSAFSPINQSRPGSANDVSDERWHYSLGHWVEDDPSAGDGAFSSPGRFGFYPWIDASKTWYGVLARHDTVNLGSADPTLAPYHTSRLCGRKIRQAWIKPV